jgi:hypothetical protein
VVLATLNSDEFVDKPPLQVYAILLEREHYVGSVATMYRVLRENTQVRERRRLATHPPRKVPELIATGPGQVYSWDITKLARPVKGTYYDAYVMIDIFSRYIVGAIVHACEDGLLTKEMMTDAFGLHGIPEVVHSDGGPSMTSKTVKTLLADLGVVRSRSRPHVSNDNPYSESLFKTMKYLPVFPDRFASLAHARQFLNEFVHAYNHHHRHTGIGMPPRRALRPRGRYRPRPRRRARDRPPRPPRTLQRPREHPTQDPRPRSRCLDQPTTSRRDPTRRLTPTDLIHLDKFRPVRIWKQDSGTATVEFIDHEQIDAAVARGHGGI